MFIKTQLLKQSKSKVSKVPIIRGMVAFVDSLVTGMKTLTYSAEILEKFDRIDGDDDDAGVEESRDEESSNGFGVAIVGAVILALVFTVGIFIILPTVVVNFADNFIESPTLLNLGEGVFRILLFVGYVLLISKMKDIQRVFQYHGAEHQTIHCFEGDLPLTPENAETYETLHPRCGTSFLMFVMIISLLLFSLLGWPNLLIRIASRLLLIPIIAGLSYELLRFAGRSNNIVVEILSVPGLLLQKLTTRKPDRDQLEVAIAALKSVLVEEDEPLIEGFCDKDGKLLPDKIKEMLELIRETDEEAYINLKAELEEAVDITEETFA
jgi:uncharacterized protein YqhQ